MESTELVKLWEDLFVARGLITAPEEKTECCFAVQDKVWVKDPDGNTWEIFFVHEQLPVEEKATLGVCSPETSVLGKKCC